MLYNYRLLYPIKFVDGDTVDLVLDLGFRLRMENRFRLTIVDTPERGQANYYEAKYFTEDWILSRLENDVVIYVNTYKSDNDDNFGRWLADIWVPGDESLSSALLHRGLAKVWEKK